VTNHSLDKLLANIGSSSKNSSALGSAVELVVDWALHQSLLYGQRIARAERWESWAKRHNCAVTQDIGIDRIVTTVDGDHWAVQVKGHDSQRDGATILPEQTNVGLDAWAKLVAAKPLIPDCTKLIVVTTGRGFTTKASQMNLATVAGVVIHDRGWMRATGTFPKDLADLKTGLIAVRSNLAARHPKHY
jgi:hypothetical protein